VRLAVALLALAAAVPRLAAQQPVPPDSTRPAAASTPRAHSSSHHLLRFVGGAVTSILAHEAGHVVAAYAVGGHPSFGFNKGRPTIYSGIDATLEPRKQFIFSSAGLTVQSLLDEGILDIPHHKGGSFERGLLAGGIGTALFYITIGRNASVSDVNFMARTSSLSKTQVSLIWGGIAVMHMVRIHLDHNYAHFFAAPDGDGRLRVGVNILPER
jgi:hypothetical protein